MKIKLDSWAHDTDAGLDLYATEDILVPYGPQADAAADPYKDTR